MERKRRSVNENLRLDREMSRMTIHRIMREGRIANTVQSGPPSFFTLHGNGELGVNSEKPFASVKTKSLHFRRVSGNTRDYVTYGRDGS